MPTFAQRQMIIPLKVNSYHILVLRLSPRLSDCIRAISSEVCRKWNQRYATRFDLRYLHGSRCDKGNAYAGRLPGEPGSRCLEVEVYTFDPYVEDLILHD